MRGHCRRPSTCASRVPLCAGYVRTTDRELCSSSRCVFDSERRLLLESPRPSATPGSPEMANGRDVTRLGGAWAVDSRTGRACGRRRRWLPRNPEDTAGARPQQPRFHLIVLKHRHPSFPQ